MYLSRRSAQDYFGLILWNCLEMSCNSKTAVCRAEWIGIWDSGVIVQHTWGTFDLIVFNAILGSFSAHLSNWLLTQTWLSVEVFRLKFRTLGH